MLSFPRLTLESNHISFAARLREYMGKQEHKLCHHPQCRAFLITHCSAKQREGFGTGTLQCTESQEVGCYCSPDQTTVEKGRHPKGMI